ncbi:ubiquitin C-terminal hydrolase Ubp14 [Malassezia pachydermatis]
MCEHVAAHEQALRVPSSSDQVFKDDCMLCFDSPDTDHGVCVCLHCFRTGCVGDAERAHAGMHATYASHPLAMWVRRRPKPSEPVTRLAVVEKSDEEMYEYERYAMCLACDPVHGRRIVSTSKIDAVIDGIVHATSSAHQTEVQAWEEDIVACEHTLTVPQDELTSPPTLGEGATCAACDLTSNLWMCLQCGYLGCGRAQFGGLAGHGHALAHYEATGHACSVKQGTITPEGTADVYCYACNDARLDPELSVHLQRLGVPVASLSKTEKSMTELQLEQNVQFDFRMVDDDGAAMVPAYGAHRTGMQNLGNSCYMASTLQSVFALPAFQRRFDDVMEHAKVCTKPPHDCLECQVRKLADGLASGRYMTQGIKPAMLKAVLGRGHPEFASMRQQDAEEFLQHLVTSLQRLPGPTDPTRTLSYTLEHRLQCTSCRKVRYSYEHVDAGLGLPVPLHETAPGEYEPVTLQQSLEAYARAETIQYDCPSCQTSVEATKQTRFATLPDVLYIQAQRFQLINWVPQKVNVAYQVPLQDAVDLSAYLGQGMQPDEVALPETDQHAEPAMDADAIAMLTSMGFSHARAQHALLATGSDVEAAVGWLFEHADDASLDVPPTQQPSASPVDTSALEEMGFSAAQARKALRVQGNDIERAVAWLFENPDDVGEEDSVAAPAAHDDAARYGTSETPARYELVSFITHRGPSVHSGHYVAHVRSGHDWIFFNDEKVVHAPSEGSSSAAALSELAYLYCLRRI